MPGTHPFAAITDYLNCTFAFESFADALPIFIRKLVEVLGEKFAPVVERDKGDIGYKKALDHIARINRFDSWRHVVTEAKLNRITETAYRSGLLVAYKIEDALDNWRSDDSFVDDFRAFEFCKADILVWYRRGGDEAEGEEKLAMPQDPSEYQEEFDEWLVNVYLFRYTGTVVPATPTKVLPLLNDKCFFAPMFFWHCGRFIDLGEI